MSPPIAVVLRRPRAGERRLGVRDRAALACALELGAGLEAEVEAFALGDPRDDDALALALRAGCHRATRVDDRGLKRLDYLAAARHLALVLRRATPGLVVCGDDEHGGAIGPALAEWLELPHLGGVIAAHADGGALLIERRVAGATHRYRVPLPALVCVAGFTPAGRAARAVDRARAPVVVDPLELEPGGLELRNAVSAAPTRRTPPRAELLDARALAARLRRPPAAAEEP
jgi:electron transfer flavoprotein alpha/beta subunit